MSISVIKAKIRMCIDEDALTKAIYSEVNHGKFIKRSNIGGWHSTYKLHEIENEHFNQLSVQILDFCNHLLLTNCSSKHSKNFVLSQFWFNLNKSGHWNAPHKHLNESTSDDSLNSCDWSGVYYFKNGIDDCSESYGGELIVFHSDKLGMVNHLVIKPEKDLLILFPSYVLHMVAPLYSNLDRISFAFNISDRSLNNE